MKLPFLCVATFLLFTACCRHAAFAEDQKRTRQGLYKFVRERSEVVAATTGKVTIYKLEMKDAVSGEDALFNFGKSLQGEFEEGDFILVKAQEGYGGFWIIGCKKYEPRFGEELPGAYVFNSIITDKLEGKDRIGILLLKLGQEYRYYVPMAEDKDGKTVPNAEILGQVRGFRPGNTVMVEIDEYSSPPELESIRKYASGDDSDTGPGANGPPVGWTQPEPVAAPVKVVPSPPEASRPAAAVAGQARKKGVYKYLEERSETVKTIEGDTTVYRLRMQEALSGTDVLITSMKYFGEEFRSGEYVYVETVDLYGGLWAVAWLRYEIVPGEEQPGAYVLSHSVESRIDGRVRLGVVLRKLGTEQVCYIPSVPDEKGEEQYDFKILHQIGVLLAKGQLVEVEVDVFSNPREIRSIRHYGASKKEDKQEKKKENKVEGTPE